MQQPGQFRLFSKVKQPGEFFRRIRHVAKVGR